MVDRGSFRDMSHLSFVEDRLRSFAPTNTKTSLPDDWVPNAWSVICGRGKECYDHGKRTRQASSYCYTVE